MQKYYTVYLQANDKVVAFGSAEQCAKMLGFGSKSDFHSMVSHTKHGHTKKYAVVTEDLLDINSAE